MPPADVSVVDIIAGGSTYSFWLDGDVYQQSVDQFPGKIVIGDQSLSDQSLASEWVFIKDLRDGAGIKYHSPGITDRRFWATKAIETRFQNSVHLTTDADADLTIDEDIVWAGGLGLDNYILFITGTTIYRRLDNEAIGAGGHDPSAGAGGRSATWFNGVMYAWFTTVYVTSSNNGAAWSSDQAAAGIYATVYDNTLYKITAAGVISHGADETSPLTATDWIDDNEGFSILPGHTIQGMVTWKDNDGQPAIVIGTTLGAYRFDPHTDEIYPLFEFQYHDAFHCKAMEVFNQDLYISSRHGIIRLTGSQNIPMGLDQDDGIDIDEDGDVPVLGRVTDMVGLNNLLLVSTDNNGESGEDGAVWGWNGRGWHAIGLPGGGTSIPAIAWTNGFLHICTDHATDVVYDLALHDTQKNPLTTSGRKYISTGELWTGFSALGLEEVPKLALNGTVRARNLVAHANNSYRIEFAIDDAADYDDNVLFNNNGTTAGVNGALVSSFASGLGLAFRNIAFKLTITRHTETTTPVIVSAKLRWMPAPNTLYSRSFGADISRIGPTGRSKLEQITDLETIQAVQTMVQVRFGRTPDTTHTGRLINIGGIRGAANVYDPARWELTHVEII